MMKYIIQYILFLFPCVLVAQTYNINKIPKELIANSDAIIRFDETIFTIESVGKATEQHNWAVTILNEKGDENHGVLKAFYNKLSKIKKIEGSIYDENGALIRKLKNSEIQDYSLNSFNSDIGDNRIKIATFEKKGYTYPYTVEFSYSEETKNMLFFPIWQPNQYPNTAVQASKLQLIIPKELSFRKKEINFPALTKIENMGGKTLYEWRVENLLPYKEKHFIDVDEGKIKVLTAPVEFEVEGYRGLVKSWSDLGKFYAMLNQNRAILPQEIKDKVRELVKNEREPREKIKILYKYLQENTRYVSVQLGIGGWQTIEAKDVAKNGYGDCKALSNYMSALLTEAGIKSFQALIYAGPISKPIYQDFANMQFNHVITCVPMPKDTIWLECTNQVTPFGYLGSFTGNRQALLILPDGGKIVHTEKYSSEENSQIRKGNIRIDENGDGILELKTNYMGIQQENRLSVMKNMNQGEQREWILKQIPIPSFSVDKLNYRDIQGKVPSIEEVLNIKVSKILTKSGSRYFISPNLMTIFPDVPLEEEDRKDKLFLNTNSFNFQDIDSLSFELPSNLHLEYLPQSIKFISKFGEYDSWFVFKNHILIYYRRVKLVGGLFEAIEYKDWVEFIRKIKKNDRLKVVFIDRVQK